MVTGTDLDGNLDYTRRADNGNMIDKVINLIARGKNMYNNPQ